MTKFSGRAMTCDMATQSLAWPSFSLTDISLSVNSSLTTAAGTQHGTVCVFLSLLLLCVCVCVCVCVQEGGGIIHYINVVADSKQNKQGVLAEVFLVFSLQHETTMAGTAPEARPNSVCMAT